MNEKKTLMIEQESKFLRARVIEIENTLHNMLERLIETFQQIQLQGSIELLTAKDLAAQFKISIQQVYELARTNRLPTVRLGQRQVRFNAAAIRRWIDQGGLTEDEDTKY
jgi:excisionase family DNA binding protein